MIGRAMHREKMRTISRQKIIEKIKDASKLGYSKQWYTENNTIVDSLLDAHWCEEDDLLSAYQALQNEDLDLVMVFFQLPFIVRLPEKWFPIRTEHGPQYVLFRTVGTAYNSIKKGGDFQIERRSKYGDIEKFQNAMLPNDMFGMLSRTQVIISFHLFGYRQGRYPKYLSSLSDEQSFKSVIFPLPRGKTTSSRPLTPGTYETNLSDRLLLESVHLLKGFIPTYAVSCKDPFAHIPEKLDNYFMMVKTGRIIVRGPGKSTVAQFAKPYQFNDYSGNLKPLKNRLNSNRPPTVYETYMLEAARQAEVGASNLAVVLTWMILDWFANEIIQDHIIRKIHQSLEHMPKLPSIISERFWYSKNKKRGVPSTEEKFLNYLPVLGIELPSNLKGEITYIKKLRNDIVHSKQADPIESSAALRAVNAGMAIIQHSMHSLLILKKSNKNDEG